MAIPLKIKASSAVAQGERHSGQVAAQDLPRLREVLASSDARIAVEVKAGRDPARHAQLRLQAAGTLSLRCQRCEQPFDWPLALDEELRLVDNEAEEARVMAETEPYLVQDDILPLRELVEDEILLALPMLPRCQSCENTPQSPPEVAQSGSRPNPFAQLKKLKF